MNAKLIFESIAKEDCLSVKQLNGGVTNLSFMVQAPSGHYILRIPGKGTNEYINREWEIENMRKASGLGFVPEMIYADAATGIIISHYIEDNVPMCRDDLNHEKRLRLINERLVGLHRSSIAFSNEFDLIKTRKKYERILAGMGARPPEELLEQIPGLLKATEYLFTAYKKELVPCHGDPKLNNFLLQGNDMWLIDWEYSGMAEKYFDLANLIMTDRLNETEEELLLNSYEECSGKKLNREKYILYKVATDYLWIYWHLIKLFQGEMTEYNEISWRYRLHRALGNMKELAGGTWKCRELF